MPLAQPEHPERSALGILRVVVDEMRVQSKGRSMTTVTPVTIARSFDCARKSAHADSIGNKRAPLRMLVMGLGYLAALERCSQISDFLRTTAPQV